MREDLVYISYNELNALREAKRLALHIADERAIEACDLRAKLKVSNDDKIALYAAINDLRAQLAKAEAEIAALKAVKK